MFGIRGKVIFWRWGGRVYKRRLSRGRRSHGQGRGRGGGGVVQKPEFLLDDHTRAGALVTSCTKDIRGSILVGSRVVLAHKLHAFRTLKVDIVQRRPFVLEHRVVAWGGPECQALVPVHHASFVHRHPRFHVVEKQRHPFLVPCLLLELSHKGRTAVFDMVDAMALRRHVRFRYLVLLLRPQVLFLVGAPNHRKLGVAVELALASVVFALTLLGVGAGGLQGALVGLDLLGIVADGMLELLAMVIQSSPFLFMFSC